jgi:hypothetical protein
MPEPIKINTPNTIIDSQIKNRVMFFIFISLPSMPIDWAYTLGLSALFNVSFLGSGQTWWMRF